MFEKFLYRLSISKYKTHLILKGGVLLYCEDFDIRQTTDIDFLGYELPNNKSRIKSIIQEICEIPNNDSIIFHGDRISIQDTMIAQEYGGLKVKIPFSFTTMHRNLLIDIGFHDIIHPRARTISYPSLITNKSFAIMAYTTESFVAEKIHSIYILGDFSSRMKDYYDLFKLSEKIPFNQIVLLKAITATFERRETEVIPNNLRDVLDDDTLGELFLQYCKKKELDLISFKTVTTRLMKLFLPIFILIEAKSSKYKKIWNTNTFQWM
ncbi:MAG: nucleotidyl transferase AbiEii/AbiGii toxin family protein [Promethearchaeota archaeon]